MTLNLYCLNNELIVAEKEMNFKESDLSLSNGIVLGSLLNKQGYNAILQFSPFYTIGYKRWSTIPSNHHIVGTPLFDSPGDMINRLQKRSPEKPREVHVKTMNENFKRQIAMHSGWGPNLLGYRFHPLKPGPPEQILQQLRSIYLCVKNTSHESFTLFLTGTCASGKTTLIETLIERATPWKM